MRIALSTAALALLSTGSHATIRGGNTQKKRSLKIDGCLDNSFSKTFRKSSRVSVCKYDNVANKVFENKGGTCTATRDELMIDLLGVADLEAAKEKVAEMCGTMYDAAADDPYHKYDFAKISNKGNVWDTEFYSGGTYWNYEVETDDGDNHLREDAARVRRTYDYQAQKKMINLPLYLESFNPKQDGCEIDAAYCCWVQDRQANDNNGNCNTPYDSQCIDRDPADNANFCYTDHERAPSVSHIKGGFSIFTDVERGTENIEGPIHCHGFAWGSGGNDLNNVYRGNNLFFVSMYDHMHQRGYVRNAPGSPMCACAENMAVVTRADCTEISVTEIIRVKYNATEASLDLNLDRIEDLNFNSCNGANNNNNDLEAYYERLVNEGRQPEENLAKLRESLVGDNNGECNAAVKNFLETKGIILTPDETAAAGAMMAGSAMMPGSPMMPGSAMVPGSPMTPGTAETEGDSEVKVIDPDLEIASGGGGEMPEVPSEMASGAEAETVEATEAPEPVEADAPIPDSDVDVEPETSDLGDHMAPCDPANQGRDCKSGKCDADNKCTEPSDNPVVGPAEVVGAQVEPTFESDCVPEGEACDIHDDCCSGQQCAGVEGDRICGAI